MTNKEPVVLETVSEDRLTLLLDGAKLDFKMQTSARYKREAGVMVSIITELLASRLAIQAPEPKEIEVKAWEANDELREICSKLAGAKQYDNGGATMPPVAVCHEAAFFLNSLCRERDFLLEHVKNEAMRADDNLGRALDAETKFRTTAASLDRHSAALMNLASAFPSLRSEQVEMPPKWMLEPAAIYLEMVDDDETGSNIVVANYLRSLAAAPNLGATK